MFAKLENKILFWIIVILGVFGVVLLYWQGRQYQKAGLNQLRQQARGIYHYVVLTRELISGWKGVYIQKDDAFVRKTPSEFTADLASFAGSNAPFSIKIAVTGSTSPAHRPDRFEQNAIQRMKVQGETEVWKIFEDEDRYRFRYAGPLIFENECQGCHSSIPSTKLVGCISIGINATRFFHNLQKDARFFAIYMVFALVITAFLLWFMLRNYVISPVRQLNNAAELVRNGRLDVSVNLTASTEWKRVGENFNNMVQALAKRQNQLEKEAQEALERMKSAFEELKKTEKYKADFFTNITHDLKTPITAIKGAVGILERRCSEGATYLNILQRNTEKLSSMVQDILDCSRLESGEMQLNLQEADLTEVLEDAILMSMPLAWKKDVKLDYKVPDHPCLARIDVKRMEQVIINLLSNAIKFSPRGETVEIRLGWKKDFWKVTIEDRGPGIQPDEVELVFEKFFHRDDNVQGAGMGLGLAIARGIVEAHSGHIGVRTDMDKPGCCFYFTVPVWEESKERLS